MTPAQHCLLLLPPSPFDVGGQQAVFHINAVYTGDGDMDEGEAGEGRRLTLAGAGPAAVACWDTLWEACQLGLEVGK